MHLAAAPAATAAAAVAAETAAAAQLRTAAQRQLLPGTRNVLEGTAVHLALEVLPAMPKF